MREDQPAAPAERTKVVVITDDADFNRLVRSTFGTNSQINLVVHEGALGNVADQIDLRDVTVVIADIDLDRDSDVQSLQSFAMQLNGWPPIIVVTRAFNQVVARHLLHLRIADFLVKPVAPIDLVRACGRAAQNPKVEPEAEAQIYTFLPAAGGVGITTLAIETAMILLKARKQSASTCLVDLDFQQGACADYLDIEPRLDLREIEPRPERLDSQLLEVMLSHHSSGLAVIAAPNRPAEMRTFDPDMVTRLLDLVSSNFQNVVIDMPRTWFPWTDSILFGSNQLFIVTEMTVPGLRHAKQLVAAVGERLKGGPQPQVIVNRFENSWFGPGLRRADIEQGLGQAYAGVIPNNYALAREAIDRGVPLEEIKAGNNISAALRKLILSQAKVKSTARQGAAEPKARKLFWAR